MFQLSDKIVMDDGAKVRFTADGYLAAAPRVSRTGIQLYHGSEIGKPEIPVVRVYRPESEVFRADSMHSFGHRPVTDDHPPVPVTAQNWRDYGRGQTDGEVVRDGEFIRVPMVLMDQALIQKYKDGKAELSVGYTCDIAWESGVTPQGETYDAVQKDIRANHVAVVDNARGGNLLRIGDHGVNSVSEMIRHALDSKIESTKDVKDADRFLDSEKKFPYAVGDTVYRRGLLAAKETAKDKGTVALADALLKIIDSKLKEKIMTDVTLRKTVIDGVSVEMTDVASQVVDRHIKSLTDSVSDLTKKLTDANAGLEKIKKEKEEEAAKAKAKEANDAAKIAALEAQVKDSAVTPAKLDQMVKDREAVSAKAKSILPTVVIDGKTVSEVRKQVVDAKLGDAAKAYTDDQVTVAFDTLTAGVVVAAGGSNGVDDTARAFSTPMNDSLSQKYQARDKRIEDSWKTAVA